MLIKLSALLTIIPILNVFGETLPSISYISKEQIKDIGGSVLLQCAINDAKDYNVAWVKIGNGPGDLVIISARSALVLRDSRFTFRYDPSPPSTYTIQIMDLQKTDAGIYQCRVILSDDNKITADVNLYVRRPPTIFLENSTQSSLVTSEGNSVQMECYADGYPTPTITWRRMNNALLPTDGYIGNILEIASVRKEDRGTYYCVADNGVSKGDRLSINLVVGFAPVITVYHASAGQALHYDKYLGCHVEAYPPPEIVWIKEELLSTNEHYSISNFATTDEVTDTILRVITIEKQQYGDYYCRATNKYGWVENKINLYETSVPTCTTDCDDSSDV